MLPRVSCFQHLILPDSASYNCHVFTSAVSLRVFHKIMMANEKKTRSGRVSKHPSWLDDFESGDIPQPKKQSTTKAEDKLWEIEDVLEIDASTNKARVSWVGYDGTDWVDLGGNPELRSFLYHNRANPSSCNIEREQLAQTAYPGTMELDDDILVIRQAIYDQLGEARRTQEGNVGYRRTVHVTVPFPVASWQRHFMPVLGLRELGNFEANVSVGKLDEVLGAGWSVRSYCTTTETYISTRSRITIKWGYKVRPLYNHDSCLRCAFQGPEGDRPELCSGYREEHLPGPASLKLIFNRRRHNRVATQVKTAKDDAAR